MPNENESQLGFYNSLNELERAAYNEIDDELSLPSDYKNEWLGLNIVNFQELKPIPTFEDYVKNKAGTWSQDFISYVLIKSDRIKKEAIDALSKDFNENLASIKADIKNGPERAKEFYRKAAAILEK